MKSTIIYLGVFALTVFTSCNANNGLKSELFGQQDISTFYMGNEQDFNLFTSEVTKTSLLENASIIENDSTVFEAITAFKSTYLKSIEEVITEDNLITEYQEEEVFPIALNNKILKTIAEDDIITENTSTEEVHPLDFKLINATLNKSKNAAVDINNLDKNALKF